VPDWVAVSVGDGCTIAGTWKGLREMHALGFIPRLPRMLGVQADGARPLVDAWESGHDLAPGPAEVIDHVPSGRLARDGDGLVPLDGDSLRERRKLLWNGAAAAASVIDKRAGRSHHPKCPCAASTMATARWARPSPRD
jgi:hypothetical protein